jgi:hypothetical protein
VINIASRRVESEKANSYEARYRSIYEGYRRSYPHIAADFVSTEDFNVFLSSLKALLGDLMTGNFETESSSHSLISGLDINSDVAYGKIVKRGMSDFDGSRVDMDMRINSVSKISTRLF